MQIKSLIHARRVVSASLRSASSSTPSEESSRTILSRPNVPLCNASMSSRKAGLTSEVSTGVPDSRSSMISQASSGDIFRITRRFMWRTQSPTASPVTKGVSTTFTPSPSSIVTVSTATSITFAGIVRHIVAWLAECSVVVEGINKSYYL